MFPRNRKTLVLLVALTLSSIAFLLAAGEARAEKRHAPEEVRAEVRAADGEPKVAVADAGAAGPAVEAPSAAEEETPPAGSELSAETLPVEAPVVELPSVATLADSVSATVDYQDSAPVPPYELAPDPMSLPEFVTSPVYQPDPMPAAEPWTNFALPEGPWFAPQSYPAYDPLAPGNLGEVTGSLGPPPVYAPGTQAPAAPAGSALAPEPGSGKNQPLLPRVQEPLLPRAQEPPGPLPSVLPPPLLSRNEANAAAPIRPTPASDDRKTPASKTAISKAPAPVPNTPKNPLVTPGVSKVPPPGVLAKPAEGPRTLPALGAAATSAVETLQSAATNAAASLAAGVSEALAAVEASPESSSETRGSSGGVTPRPPSPSPPPSGGNSFSLPGGGQAGPGSVLPLLLCVLASGLILLRRDGPLSLASHELPEPSSALLIPLERPG